MNRIYQLMLGLLVTTVAQAEPPKVLLWPNGAPGAHGNEPTDQPWVDVWQAAKDKANGAAFVVCPGGGYGGLAADHEGIQPAKFFNSLGISAFVLHYRLGSKGYHFPIELNDVQRAIRHVRANAAQYGVDPQRIGVIGFSAGGHLTSMAATLFEDGKADAEDKEDEEAEFFCCCRRGLCILSRPGPRASRGT